ncbi:MAG: hypothetical protein IKN83_06125 [Bacteroidaceae bacterium]|nr:hypothetical protein [Bacteroidaceae bacterium]
MRTLLLNMMLLGFLPLNAQKLYVCQDNFSYELTMTDNDTVFYQVDEEDQRIAFGLNLVFNIEQVDSVVFDKPTHLKNVQMGWIETPSKSVQLYVVPPLKDMGMTSSQFSVTENDEQQTEDVSYTARFESKDAAKSYVDIIKESASSLFVPTRSIARYQHDLRMMLSENSDYGDVEWSADSCVVTISLQELFKGMSIIDTRRLLFYWENYNSANAHPHTSLLPREPVFGTLKEVEYGYEYTTHLGTSDAACKAKINSYSENNKNYYTIYLTLEFGNKEDATSFIDMLKEQANDNILISRGYNKIMMSFPLPQVLSYEELMLTIIRFDLESHRPFLKPALSEDIIENLAKDYMEINNELGISIATIDAFINQHIDWMDSVCVNTRLGILKAMQLYLNPSELIELKKMGRMMNTADGGRICLFNNALPISIADSLWDRMTRQIDVQPIYDEYFLMNKMQSLSNHIFHSSQFEQVSVDDSFGIPYNSYLSVRPKSPTRQDGVCIDLKTVMLPRTYEMEVTFAPDVVEHTDSLPGHVRFLFFHNRDGKSDMNGFEEPSYVINEKDNSKNFVVDDNNDECVTVRFEWTAPAMLNTVYFEVDSYVPTHLQRTYQKDFRLAKITLKPKNTR